VLIATFGDQRLVYKPRPLAVDRAFQELLTGLEPSQRTIGIDDRGEYGWAEFVAPAPCADEAAAERYYERTGALLAILHAVGATDLHLENLIAAGEYPIVIDLETLFHPRLTPAAQSGAEQAALELVARSVLSIGLLPGGRAGDVSGIGATPGQTLPFEVDAWEGAGTDEVRLKKVKSRIGAVPSRPTLNGTPVDPLAFAEALDRGFARQYERLRARPPDFSAFRTLSIRAVLRTSSTYAALLAESTHPNLLRNMIDTELLFNQLWQPEFARILPSERRQLLDGDIPAFVTTPESRDLQGHDGTRIGGILHETGLEAANARMAVLGAADLRRQLWFLRASLASLGTRATAMARPERIDARVIGDFLVDTAVHDGPEATWITLRHSDDRYKIGLAGYDLYSGLAGVALFLAYLARQTGDERYRTLAAGALATIEGRIAALKARPLPGAFNGLGGILYLYDHLATLWDRPDLRDRACGLLPDLAAHIETDAVGDVIAGSAGCIPILLALGADDLAKRCGERLLTRQDGLPYPRGFAHGLAGVAWALGELGETEAALQAAARERQLLAKGVWNDIPGNERQTAWCHGAAGIALSRLALFRRTQDAAIKADAVAALEHHLQSPLAANHTLCHGALGNLEPLRLAAEMFPEDARWAQALADATRAAHADIAQRGLQSPQPWPLIEPGLMMGLAGMGLDLLRADDPDAIPSVLLLSRCRSSPR
jgi:type 2 lantibiotic biosynthesis protein LanM